MKRILITGATGFLGSYIARTLVEDERYQVLALRRSNSRLDLLGNVRDAVTWYEADILDVATLDGIVQNCDMIIHSAAIISFQRKDFGQMHRVNVDGTANLVNLATYHGIEKFVYISSIAALGRHAPGKVITEQDSWADGPFNTRYGLSKHKGELEVWRGQTEGLPTIILNPSLILGAGYWHHGTPGIFDRIAAGTRFFPGGSNGVVDVRDVAKAVKIAIEKNLSAQRLIISGENLTYRDLLHYIAQALGQKGPAFEVSGFLGALAWRADWLKSLMTRRERLLTRESLRSISHNSLYDNTKSRELLGLTYRGIRETITATAHAYKTAVLQKKDFGLLSLD